MPKVRRHHQYRLQSGVALIAALVIMLILTIIGATSISMTSLEERMAFNSQDYQQARYMAESAILLYANQDNMPNPAQPGISATSFSIPTGTGSPLPNLQAGNVAFTYIGEAQVANLPSPSTVISVPLLEPQSTFRVTANVTTGAGTNGQRVYGYYFYKPSSN
jgi:type II secretory pathway component PulK